MIKWTDSSYILFKGFANNSTNLLLTKTYSQINSDLGHDCKTFLTTILFFANSTNWNIENKCVRKNIGDRYWLILNTFRQFYSEFIILKKFVINNNWELLLAKPFIWNKSNITQFFFS